jgi:hypothetical protein
MMAARSSNPKATLLVKRPAESDESKTTAWAIISRPKKGKFELYVNYNESDEDSNIENDIMSMSAYYAGWEEDHGQDKSMYDEALDKAMGEIRFTRRPPIQ